MSVSVYRDAATALRALVESRTGAVLGAGVYAAWATAVNWDGGAAVALRAGAFHWIASTLLTLYGVHAMRRCFAFGSSALSRAACAFAGGLALTYGALVVLHHLIGTPHVALALAAGVLPTVAFCAGYSALLVRTSREGVLPC